MFRFNFFLTLCFLITDCSNNKDIRSFYFPIEELKAGAIYEYQPVDNDSLASFYYYFKSTEDEGQLFLEGIYLNPYMEPTQRTKEEVVSNGTLLTEINFYMPDTSEQVVFVPVEILAGSVFPFEVSDSNGVFLQQLKWSDPSETYSVNTLTRNRRYLKDTSYTYNGDSVDAVKFRLNEVFDNEQVGHLELPQYSGVELYAKNIGLVYFRKRINSNYIPEYALRAVYTLQEFEEKFGIKF